MNTLSTFHQRPLTCMTINPSSWDQKSQPFYFTSTTPNNLVKPSQTCWKLHAQSKGFGGNSSNSMQKKGSSSNQQEDGDGDGGDDDDDDKIPKVVFDRMIKRILASVGLPLALGFAMLQVFAILKENHVEVPLWVAYITIFVLFGGSVLGVAYGSLSTSWDPEKQGSVLGFEEAMVNWDEMWKEEEEGKN